MALMFETYLFTRSLKLKEFVMKLFVVLTRNVYEKNNVHFNVLHYTLICNHSKLFLFANDSLPLMVRRDRYG